MSLRSRLAVLFGLVALVASMLVGVISYRSTSNELRDSTDRFLELRAIETAEAANEQADQGRTDDRTRSRPDRGARLRDGLPVADDDSVIQLTGPEGNGVSSSIELPQTPAVEQLQQRRPGPGDVERVVFENVDVDGESYRMASQALDQGGAVQVARSTAENDDLLAALVRRFVLIAALVALGAALLGWLIATTTTAPLRRLTIVASDVADTKDFTTDVGETDRSDEIGQLASSFATMLAALETSREQQHRLIHDAGHEMRTPLTSLRANVALLERARDLPEADRTEILAAIRSELLELGDLFDEMIDLATEQRSGELVGEPVDLADVVSAVAARWERRGDRPIHLEIEPSVVVGDATMLERAVNNLVSNADKFSEPGEAVTIVVADGRVIVRDRGPGIPPHDRDRIFDRFYRSEVTRSMPGSGLGLSIVAEVVERHGGEVWAHDAPGGGAEVGFSIPEVLAAQVSS